MSNLEKRLDTIEAARIGILDTFVDNRVGPEEALTCLTGLLVQVYVQMVNDNSRENFLNIMGQCYDAYGEIVNNKETLQ